MGCIIVLIAVGGLYWRFQRAATALPLPPFCTPPDPLPAGAPGTIIRKELLTNNLSEGAVAWRVMYLSTGVNGEPIAVMGVVFAPKEAGASPRPVIACRCCQGELADAYQA